MTAVYGAAMFLVAGTARWAWGWAYLAVLLAVLSAYAWILFTIHPDLAGERTRPPADAKRWDKPLVAIVGGLGPILLLLCCALDRRLGFSPEMPWGWHLPGFAMVAVGGAFTNWAVSHNRFFSALIRIQRDRGHRVIDTGPYRIVRHPGYTGSILHTLGTSLALGSWWSFAVGIPLCMVIAARTALEDGTLRTELEGYEAYASRVRSRLIPGLW